MSSATFATRRDWLERVDSRRLLANGLRGFEKECLRVDGEGRLAGTPHSRRFGSALTHPWITTDYSEALLEFVTPPFPRNEPALELLADLHAFVTRHAGDELLWPASMPCIVAVDEAVPIAQYGSSNEGRLRSIYRSGLGYRYGRTMQAIAGTHFNYSLPAGFWPAAHEQFGSRLEPQAFKSESLLGLARNYRRSGWLLCYLFGASPAFCKSFRPSGHPRLESLDAGTWYAPYSTSLRMSDMGYRNSTQARLVISLNSLDEYLRELKTALTTVDPRYQAIGVCVDGDYRQLNANVLQLENEYYSSIRPKPASKSPRLIAALAASGVEYVEVRTLDLNPFEPVGVADAQARVAELLLVYCLLEESPPITAFEHDEIDQRELSVAWEGRRPGLELPRGGVSVKLSDWALQLVESLETLVPLLEDARGSYAAAIAAARAAVLNPELTLSARVLDELAAGRMPFFEWAFALAESHREHFRGHGYGPGRKDELERMAADSLAAAAAAEAAPQIEFARYLSDFLASGLDG